jgi:UDP-GlcNAc:undecaprenyl-phosphate GlcNAc-1-phosphate transferase
MIYFFIVTVFVISALLASVIIPRILLVSYKKRLFDVPDARKVHTTPVPRLGGISFFPVLLVTLCLAMGLRYLFNFPIEHLSANQVFIQFMFFVAGLTLLYLVGVVDDLIGVGYFYKLAVQLMSACLFPLSGLWFNSLGGLFGICDLPAWIGMPFTIFIVVYVTNAMNLIDGIDGLASGLSCISLCVLGGISLWLGHYIHSMLAFAMLGVLVPFWIYNVYGRVERRRKIFMGDTGSLTLGYILSFIMLHLCMSGEEAACPKMFLIVFSTLLVPMFDVVRVVLSRVRDHRNPFLPDKNHIHHKFLRTGMRIRWAMASLLMVSLFFIAFNAVLVQSVDITLLCGMDILLWIIMHLILNHFIAIHEQRCPERKWVRDYSAKV